MPNNALTRLMVASNLLRAIWQFRKSFRTLDKRQAFLRAEAQNLLMRPERYAGMDAQRLGDLAAKVSAMSTASLQRKQAYRSLLWLAVRKFPFLVLHASAKPSAPPIWACFLVDLLLAKDDREAILGDMEQEFTTAKLPKYGTRRARLWFWAETVRNVATRNPVWRWVLVVGLARLMEWLFGKIGR